LYAFALDIKKLDRRWELKNRLCSDQSRPHDNVLGMKISLDTTAKKMSSTILRINSTVLRRTNNIEVVLNDYLAIQEGNEENQTMTFYDMKLENNILTLTSEEFDEDNGSCPAGEVLIMNFEKK
jgi:hypothetical protein